MFSLFLYLLVLRGLADGKLRVSASYDIWFQALLWLKLFSLALNGKRNVIPTVFFSVV